MRSGLFFRILIYKPISRVLGHKRCILKTACLGEEGRHITRSTTWFRGGWRSKGLGGIRCMGHWIHNAGQGLFGGLQYISYMITYIFIISINPAQTCINRMQYVSFLSTEGRGRIMIDKLDGNHMFLFLAYGQWNFGSVLSMCCDDTLSLPLFP